LIRLAEGQEWKREGMMKPRHVAMLAMLTVLSQAALVSVTRNAHPRLNSAFAMSAIRERLPHVLKWRTFSKRAPVMPRSAV
jgi:hypothetical protein